ncbi:MAG: hypothetical protein FJY29_03925 [Betaproteobacteria bacterium]|nr:hypothetical protein [Betaproteobacteria bacterium]
MSHASRHPSRLAHTLNPRTALLPWTSALALCGIALSGCGLTDVYQDKEKRCKINCSAEDSSEQKNDEPFNLSLDFWNQNTPRSKLDPATEVSALLRSNPFKLLANALKTVSDDANEAKQTVTTSPDSPQAQCLKEVFTAPFAKSTDTTTATLDYGKCVDLARLRERLNSSRNTDRDGKLKVLEIGSALLIKTAGSLPTLAGGDALHDAGNGFELASFFPFKLLRGSDLTQPNAVRSFSLHLVRGSVQGVALERTSAAAVLKKSWGLLYAGLDERSPLKLEWKPGAGELKLVGSLATLSASFQKPTTQTQWEAFGYSREFIFADFTISAPALELNTQLGWSDQVNMSGSYFLRLNGDLVGTGGSSSQLFRFQGLGRACVLNVGLVTGFQGEVPVEQPLGQISICNSAQ